LLGDPTTPKAYAFAEATPDKSPQKRARMVQVIHQHNILRPHHEYCPKGMTVFAPASRDFIPNFRIFKGIQQAIYAF
jgi:hypothetical protein